MLASITCWRGCRELGSLLVKPSSCWTSCLNLSFVDYSTHMITLFFKCHLAKDRLFATWQILVLFCIVTWRIWLKFLVHRWIKESVITCEDPCWKPQIPCSIKFYKKMKAAFYICSSTTKYYSCDFLKNSFTYFTREVRYTEKRRDERKSFHLLFYSPVGCNARTEPVCPSSFILGHCWWLNKCWLSAGEAQWKFSFLTLLFLAQPTEQYSSLVSSFGHFGISPFQSVTNCSSPCWGSQRQVWISVEHRFIGKLTPEHLRLQNSCAVHVF